MASSTTDRRLGLTGGTAIKAPCACATTGNITLNGEQTVDGVTTSSSRVLVKNQTDGTQNGIYDSSSGTWTRSLDADGNNDLVSGTLVRVNGGSSNATGWFELASSDPIIVGTSTLTWSREIINNVGLVHTVASAGQTVVAVSTYQLNANAVAVFVNGLRQRIGDDFTETDNSHITFTAGLNLNDEVDCYITSVVGTLAAAAANLVAVTDASDYYVSTDAEGVLQEIAQAIAADVGDNDATLTNNSSNRVQRWNTTFTGNHTATLSTSNAKEGATFIIVRGAGRVARIQINCTVPNTTWRYGKPIGRGSIDGKR